MRRREEEERWKERRGREREHTSSKLSMISSCSCSPWLRPRSTEVDDKRMFSAWSAR